MKYILDACSLIAYYKEEAGSSKVKPIIKEAAEGKVDILIHRINLFEVYYDLLRSGGKELIDAAMDSFYDSPIQVIDDINDELMKEAARFKLTYKISVADSFVLATAKLEDATLVTADHHEFDPVDKNNELSFLWFR
ncbi:MAG: type II toxin-antitoxin system VapC family toxin [Clostridiales Family XIII bacterium]|jgi:predicted nucleic acid-binding protein|nr:type II toxin-antitoxin system VapC family toxin [Clostridiales Family XIII bacterium]